MSAINKRQFIQLVTMMLYSRYQLPLEKKEINKIAMVGLSYIHSSTTSLVTFPCMDEWFQETNYSEPSQGSLVKEVGEGCEFQVQVLATTCVLTKDKLAFHT